MRGSAARSTNTTSPANIEVDDRGGAATSHLHYLLDRAGGGVVGGCRGPHLAGMRALLRVDVGNNQIPRRDASDHLVPQLRFAAPKARQIIA